MQKSYITSLPVQFPAAESVNAAVISLSKLCSNIAAIRRHCGSDVRIMAVVKADGYGHGAARIAVAAPAAGVDAFAVATVDEGVALRRAGVDSPILILGLLYRPNIPLLLEYGLIPSVCSLSEASDIDAYCVMSGRRSPVHIRVNLGNSGFGAPEEQAVELGTAVMQLQGVLLEGIYCHLSSAYMPDMTAARRDVATFGRIVAELQERGVNVPLVHAASSPAIIALPEAHFNMVRAGIILYGLPVMDEMPQFPAEPLMQIKSAIVGFKTLSEGDLYGYGNKFTAGRASRLAIVPFGYADAPFLFHLRGGDVLIRGRRAPLVGQMYMDHCMVDVSGIADAVVGDEVVLLGEQRGETIYADEIAKKAGFGHLHADCVCLLGSRTPKLYTGETST